jgi:site-specific recombinase XerD
MPISAPNPVPTTELTAQQRELANVLASWSQQARGAYATSTQRAWRADWKVFMNFCAKTGFCALPADAHTVREFVLDCRERHKKPATVRRHLATITRAHKAARCPDPCAEEPARLAMRETARLATTRQRQARGLIWSEIQRFLSIEPEHLRDHRDRALVTVGYDTLCRSEELVAIDVEHVHFESDGSATILIARSKTDQEGEGAFAYLAPATVRLLRRWLKESALKEGALFRRIAGGTIVGERLKPPAVATVVKRVGKWIGLPQEHYRMLSGHSTRVGATQDLLACNTDVGSLMQAGRWKDARMPQRYGERIIAKRGAMARMSKEQGRF